MAIKLKKDVIDFNDELNKELSIYGFQIEFNDNNKDNKKEEPKKEVKDKKIAKKK